MIDQTFGDWELIIVNDGCTDETETLIDEFLSRPNIVYIKNDSNKGLGYCINHALERARYKHIAYLPSDDYYYKGHLEDLAFHYAKNPEAVLVFSGVQFQRKDTMNGEVIIESSTTKHEFCLQLVQTSHVKTEDRWMERSVWESHDLHETFWNKLLARGAFVATNNITCFWTQHPKQRHKILNESYSGGVNQFRSHYHIDTPLKIRVHKNKFVDEGKMYENFREPALKAQDGSLKILLVGELAYNPERIYALEQAGHKLYGLWMKRPYLTFNTVGPLPFGHIEDLHIDN